MTGDLLVVGLTGSFGSGCTTMAEALKKKHDFAGYHLSSPIRTVWDEKNTLKGATPKRTELQDIGNEMRKKDGNETLAKAIATEIDKAAVERAVVDGIKNEAEVQYFRSHYPSFFLVSIQATQQERWKRVQPDYDKKNLPYSLFEQEDERDQEEDLRHGQQVALCVDDADIAISNDETRQSRTSALGALAKAFPPYMGLMNQTELRAPSEKEILMSMAYSQSKASMCVKRQVGAVISDAAANVVSSGYNENPKSMQPCYLKFGYCYKDSMIAGELELLEGTRCPQCGEVLKEIASPYHCVSCDLSLKAWYFAGRGMRWCTALHAEERALINAGSANLEDAILYTTTFPCSNCAREIAHRGIKQVVYVEPYPDKEALWYFEENGIETLLFEGVKARAFELLFKPFRVQLEKKYALDENIAK